MNENQRYTGAISLIKSQTNYTEEQAKVKLEEHDGNYMNVIKEYLNPNFRNKKKKPEKKTVNEKMMFEIRNFMDTAAEQFKKRKAQEEERQKYLKAVYDKPSILVVYMTLLEFFLVLLTVQTLCVLVNYYLIRHIAKCVNL